MGLQIAGIDVSEDQGVIDWAKVAAAGVRFAALKCYEGNKGLDSKYIQNLVAAKAAGTACGCYQFIYPIGLPSSAANPDRDAKSQAQLHWSNSQGLGCAQGDLQPFMDLEWPEKGAWAQWGCSEQQIQDYLLAYKAEYESLSGVLMGIYTDEYWWETIGGQGLTELYNTPFWSADPSKATLPNADESPRLYKPFASWSIWQYSWKVQVPGIDVLVDGNSIPDENVFLALTTRP